MQADMNLKLCWPDSDTSEQGGYGTDAIGY